jgi:hypothetical protein
VSVRARNTACLQPDPARRSVVAATGKRTVKCGKNVADPGMKLVANRRSTDPVIHRARRMPRLETFALGGVFRTPATGTGGGHNPIHTQPTQKIF